MEYHSTYKGCNIYRNTSGGYKLKWIAYVTNLFVTADTLIGIKRLIIENLNEERIRL